MKAPVLLVTCEHGGNAIPAPYRRLFRGCDRLLASHRGWDRGALELARRISRVAGAPMHASTTSRLLVDLNRSRASPTLFSPRTAALSPREQAGILRAHYAPYRRAVERAVVAGAGGGPVIHVSVHSFTPVFRSRPRRVDVGLLFDPSRPREHDLCRAWRRRLSALNPRIRIAFNKPYKGTDDGLTTHLRTRLGESAYAGIELEVNQRYPRAGETRWRTLQHDIAASLILAINALSRTS